MKVAFTRSMFNSTFKTNPWSILNYLDKGKVATYWANTSSNSLVGKLIQEGSSAVKSSFENRAMNHFMNRVALKTFSYFDAGKNASFSEPERFYHGFVLGLLVELNGQYVVTSNRESGFAFEGKTVLIG